MTKLASVSLITPRNTGKNNEEPLKHAASAVRWAGGGGGRWAGRKDDRSCNRLPPPPSPTPQKKKEKKEIFTCKKICAMIWEYVEEKVIRKSETKVNRERCVIRL